VKIFLRAELDRQNAANLHSIPAQFMHSNYAIRFSSQSVCDELRGTTNVFIILGGGDTVCMAVSGDVRQFAPIKRYIRRQNRLPRTGIDIRDGGRGGVVPRAQRCA
jgi:hypothetical protein